MSVQQHSTYLNPSKNVKIGSISQVHLTIIPVQIRISVSLLFLFWFLQLGLSPLLFCENDAAEKENESSIPASIAKQSPPKETETPNRVTESEVKSSVNLFFIY